MSAPTDRLSPATQALLARRLGLRAGDAIPRWPEAAPSTPLALPPHEPLNADTLATAPRRTTDRHQATTHHKGSQ